MININQGSNAALMSKCQVLEDYAIFVAMVREHLKHMELKAAIDQAVGVSIQKQGTFGEFLSKHQREVKNMLLTEFDEEKYLEMMRREEREDGIEIGLVRGRAEGRAEGQKILLLELLSDLGDVPGEIVKKVDSLELNQVKVWSRLALRVDSVKEFVREVEKL